MLYRVKLECICSIKWFYFFLISLGWRRPHITNSLKNFAVNIWRCVFTRIVNFTQENSEKVFQAVDISPISLSCLKIFSCYSAVSFLLCLIVTYCQYFFLMFNPDKAGLFESNFFWGMGGRFQLLPVHVSRRTNPIIAKIVTKIVNVFKMFQENIW